jgi:methyltransferase (TIGR00027 family)
MDRSKVSTTALRAAVSRAIHQIVDDEPKILTDPVAVRLVEAAAPGAIEDGKRSFSPPDLAASRATVVLRSRFAEDELAVAASQGVDQYVILGAGLDTFAFRQPPYAAALQVFEVDHPATQAWKRDSLTTAGIPLPPNLHWVPVDFERQTLSEQLATAGFDITRPAYFSWLAVTQFITLPAINDTLHFVAGLPTSSTIVLTFVLADDCLSEDDRGRKRQIVEMVAELGEPWLTFFHPDELCARVRDLGFARVFHLTPAEANDRYFGGRQDGMQVRPLEQLVSATV